LQLVHYNVTQEYTSHHDFGYARIGEGEQGARFATLLLYLNEDVEGGETSFPRWVNGESFRELTVKPVVGKAVLFYSQLPDGVRRVFGFCIVGLLGFCRPVDVRDLTRCLSLSESRRLFSACRETREGRRKGVYGIFQDVPEFHSCQCC
jgi:2OG-Fe(II) oxygenase superfamily